MWIIGVCDKCNLDQKVIILWCCDEFLIKYTEVY